MSDKVYLRDLAESGFTKDEFIDYYNRCLLFGISVCEDAKFKIGRYKNISCCIRRVQDSSVRIPDFVTEIYNEYSYSNMKIKELDLNKVTTICRDGLCYFDGLRSLNAPNVKTIGSYGLYSCRTLDNVNFSKLKYLGSRAFCSCINLKYFSSEKLETLSMSSFVATSLNELNVPNVKEIQNNSERRYNTPILLNASDKIKVYNFGCYTNFKGKYKIVESIPLEESIYSKNELLVLEKDLFMEEEIEF